MILSPEEHPAPRGFLREPLPVKMRLERPAGRDKREIKNNFSAEHG